jgi:hypothetical protein
VKKKRTRIKKMPRASAHVFIRYSIAVFSLTCLILLLQFTFQTTSVLGITDSEAGEKKSISEMMLQKFEKKRASEEARKELVFCKSPEGKVLQTNPATCERMKKMWNQEITHKEKRFLNLPDQKTKERMMEQKEKREAFIQNPSQIRKEKKEIGVEIKKRGEDMFVLKEGTLEAKTKFPLTLNPDNKQLIIKTPQGEKAVAVLPQEAVSNLMSKKIITKLDIQGNDASSSVTLTEKGNKPVFEIAGLSDQHLFGIFPIKIRKSLDVSAQTGQVVSEDVSWGQRLLDFFSF